MLLVRLLTQMALPSICNGHIGCKKPSWKYFPSLSSADDTLSKGQSLRKFEHPTVGRINRLCEAMGIYS
jgi:hypothetical protein